MANRGHTKDGQVVCSECGAIIQMDADKCEHCGESLDLDFDAIVCPYCGSVLDNTVSNCTNCGLKFKEDEKSVIRSREDEEFLSRLLDWGRKLEAKRAADPGSDKFETEKASEIFKDVIGAQDATLQEKALKDLKETAEERDEFEKREHNILQLAEPLRNALLARKETLDKAETKLSRLQIELESLGDDNVKAVKKREEVERRMAEINQEQDEIRSLEENIENMDSVYRNLLEEHRGQLIEKEKELNTRLNAFKKELERRDKEKSRLKARDDLLKQKEEELERRIRSLTNRETSLFKTEQKMKLEIEAMQKEKDGLEELREPAVQLVAAKGKWLVDEKELKTILRKSKKVREGWIKEQAEIQKAFASGETEDEVMKESDERFKAKEEELETKIKELEDRLTEAKKQDEIVKSEGAALVADENKLKKVLKVLDDLLGNLPEDEIEKFVKTKEYKMYESLMDELGL